MLTRRKILKIGASATCLAGLPFIARANVGEVRVEQGDAFASSWRLVMPGGEDARAARRVIETVIRDVDGKMSPFRDDSEIARLNAWLDTAQGAESVRISAPLRHVLSAALALAKYTDGAFDPTLSPIGRRFGFGTPLVSYRRPAGHSQDLNVRGDVLACRRPGLSLDLCANATGYALDEMVRGLAGLDFLLEVGGEVRAQGRHPSGRAWRVGLARPNSAYLQRVVALQRGALATSSNLVQGYRVGEQRYGHIIDARRLAPANRQLQSVTVWAPNAQLADGLATAAMVLGTENAREVLAHYGARGLFLRQGTHGIEEVDVLGFMQEVETEVGQ